MKRVGVFIDGSNFYKSCVENLGRANIDLGKFANWLVGADRELVRTSRELVQAADVVRDIRPADMDDFYLRAH